MRNNLCRWAAVAAAAVTLAGVPAVVVTIAGSATASADVCASAGRRISVSGCANLSDVMAPYVLPQDSYAPITPDASACIGWNGRWVSANSCT